MSLLCEERWKQEKNIRFHKLTPSFIETSPEFFQRDRRVYADAHADSPVYVVADDDCLLAEESPIGSVVQLMERAKDFSILSLMPSNAKINPWTSEDYEPFMSPTIWEHHSVGGVRFCRKGLVTTWPLQTRSGYDSEQCEQIRKEGKRVGYAIQVKMNHLGEGHSTH